ncbi:nucleotide exchange factor GrpE [Candidatus Dojkabacteria bacterium]|nr:nucleotide exchange factor GrpE [Candidatus Dojkabacteria bacterium]
MDFSEELKNYGKRAVLMAKKNLNMEEVSFDHICYQTVSKKDYESSLQFLKNKINVIQEIPHAGRRITIAELIDPVVMEGIKINRLEISEPKPKHTVRKKEFDHLAFVVKDDFDSFIEQLKGDLKITEVKQIGDHKIAKFVDDGIEIELRNKSMTGRDVKKEIPTKQKTHKAEGEREGSERNLEKLLEVEKERKLRALADYQNLQKRVQEEYKKIRAVSNALILGQLLDILDDFDRVIENLKIDEKDQVGIRMVREKLQKIIDSNGLEEIKCFKGDPFDPNLCEAVGVVALGKDEKNNQVKEVVQKGYRFKESGEVVRPIKVIVGKHN